MALGISFLVMFYSWYVLPMIGGYLQQDYVKYVFVFFLVVGNIIVLFSKFIEKKVLCEIKVPKFLVPITFYMFFLLMLCVLNIDDATKHFRISFGFWATPFVYTFLREHIVAKNVLTKVFLIMLFFTLITTLIGLIQNPEASRMLAYASNDVHEDLILKQSNIASIYFIQCLVIILPIIMAVIEKSNIKIYAVMTFIITVITILVSSFTISILMMIFVVLLYFMARRFSLKRIIFSLYVVIVFCLSFIWLVPIICDYVDNAYVTVRLLEVVDFVKNFEYDESTNLGARISLYVSSMGTFFENICGIGPKYSYIKFENGIGYHSQILDDLARYGIWGLCFYVFLFKYYLCELKMQYEKIDLEYVAYIIVFVYICFLILNLGFRSGMESIIMFYLIPNIPEFLVSSGVFRYKF